MAAGFAALPPRGLGIGPTTGLRLPAAVAPAARSGPVST